MKNGTNLSVYSPMSFPMLHNKPSPEEIMMLSLDYLEIQQRKPARGDQWTEAEEKHLTLLRHWYSDFQTTPGHCYIWYLFMSTVIKGEVSTANIFKEKCTRYLFGGSFPVFPLEKGAILGLPTRYFGEDTFAEQDKQEILRRESNDTLGVYKLYSKACLEAFESSTLRVYPKIGSGDTLTKSLARREMLEGLEKSLKKIEEPEIGKVKAAVAMAEEERLPEVPRTTPVFKEKRPIFKKSVKG